MQNIQFWAVVLLLFAGPSFAETLYVRSSSGEYGDEDGSSYAAAFDGPADISWGSGAGQVGAGDTLYVCGEITELLTVGGEGTSGSQLVIDGRCPDETGSINTGSSEAYAINFGTSSANDDYITIQHIALTGGTTATIHCNSSGGVYCDGAVIDNVVVSNSNSSGGTVSGVVLRGAKNSTVSNNIISGNALAARGIHLDNASSNLTGTNGNSVYGNIVTGFTNFGIRLSGSADSTPMEGPNYVYLNTTSGNGAGIYHVRADDVRTYSNLSHSNTLDSGAGEGYGYACEECNKTQWYGNIGYGNRTDGMEIWADGTRTSDYTFVGWNYLYANNGGGTQFLYAFQLNNGAADPSATTAHTGVVIVGNIFSGTGGANFEAGESAQIYNNYFVAEDTAFEQAAVIVGAAAGSGLDFGNNVFVGTSGAYAFWAPGTSSLTLRKNHYYITSGTTVVKSNSDTYTSGQISTWEAAAQYGDPMVDSSYVPIGGSPLLDAGTSLPVRYDYRGGKCAGGTSDIGAYCNDIVIQHGYTLKPKVRR